MGHHKYAPFTKEQYDEIKAQAEEERCTVAAIIRKALMQYLKKRGRDLPGRIY